MGMGMIVLQVKAATLLGGNQNSAISLPFTPGFIHALRLVFCGPASSFAGEFSNRRPPRFSGFELTNAGFAFKSSSLIGQ